jgi:hypothetical protein
MIRRIPLSSRVFTGALALALAVVSSAICVLNAEMTETHKACCVAMNHDCGATAVTQDCCATEPQSLTGFTAGSPAFRFAAPIPVAVDVVAGEPPLVARVNPAAAFDSGAPNPLHSPTYLLVSVFRV